MKLFKSVVAVGVILSGGLVAGPSLADVGVSNSGWAWSNPTPQGRTLHALAFAEGVGYAVGDGGTALLTTNAGQSWTGLLTGTSIALEQVQAVSASALVVGGGGGCSLRISTDSGQVFKRIFSVTESKCTEPVASFSFISPQVGFLLLKNGSLEVTTDGGESFSRRTGVPGTTASSGGGPKSGTAVHFFNASNGIAIISESNGESSEYITPDGGVSWQPVALPPGAHISGAPRVIVGEFSPRWRL